METVNILGVHVNKYTMDEAVALASLYLDEEGFNMIFTPNSEILLYASNNPEFANVLNSADMVIPDGIGVVYGAKILGNPISERVAGFDLVCNLLPIMEKKGKSLYLLGAKPGVAEAAAENLLKQYPNLKIAGTHDGYFDNDDEVIDDINKKTPDFLMVCLGFPKQENWIYDNRERLDVKLAIGAGGCLDVFAGTVQRAPEFYCKHGIEWLYRLVKQPSRFRRMPALPKFGLKVLFKGKSYK